MKRNLDSSKIAVLVLLSILISTASAFAAKRKVLFIGNSYTATNNLPLMVSQLATSQGDTLIFDSNAPGGYTLQNHFTNPTTRAKIAAGGWDFVIIQAQSQEPAFPDFVTDRLPYAVKLDSLINKIDSCTETMFYMTWGRKNGDASNCAFVPEICTYSGMQNLLSASYLTMAKSAKGSVAPVGEVWRKFRADHPTIELYNPDESHPIVSGTYLAAVVFYQSIFRKSITGTAIYRPSTLPDTTASFIRFTAQTLIQDSASKWYQHGRMATAGFGFEVQNNTVSFENTSYAASQYSWNFGDGSPESTDASPQHFYTNAGNYMVQLKIMNGCRQDSIRKMVLVLPTSVSSEMDGSEIRIFPNPFINQIEIANVNQIEKVYVTDLSGKIQKTKFADGVLHTEATQKGMYMVTVRWKNGRISNRKVLKM
jgi:PKD repeat protein